MARPQTTAQASTRISVYNLDPLEQSKLWLQQGPVDANRTLIGVLRAALLFGGTLVVDRNQVLEGIFFLAMPPDRLAWHLGLEPGAELPIEVQLLKSEDHVDPAPGPWQLSDGTRRWGARGEGVVTQIEANYAAVKNKARVSSPMIALTGGQYELADGLTQPGSHSSAATPRTAAWNTSDHLVMPQGVWEEGDVTVAKKVREQGRLAWIQAMKVGRVAVRSGQDMGPNMIGRELSTEPPPGPDEDKVIEALVTQLINLQVRDKPATADEEQCGVVHGKDVKKCERAHVNERSLVARWLDGHEVAGLDPSSLPTGLRGQEYAAHRSAALGWWSLAYYRSIAERDGTRLLTIFNALSASPTAEDDDSYASKQRRKKKAAKGKAIEIAWGLRKPERGFWAQLFARIRPLKKSKAASTLPIGGDVVDRLADFTPSQYARLKTFEAVESEQLLKKPGRRSLFDLVMAIDEVVGDTTSRARRMRTTAFRAAVFMVVAIALVLYESGHIEISGWWGPVVAVTAAALLSAPWADVGALSRMSGSKLQSTLRLQHDG